MTDVTLFSPRGHRHSSTRRLTKLRTLDDVSLGLLDNSKPNARALLDGLIPGLRERFTLMEVVRASKEVPSNAAPPHIYSSIAERCGAAIFATAD